MDLTHEWFCGQVEANKTAIFRLTRSILRRDAASKRGIATSMSGKQFDEFLRETAHREDTPIPSGLENRLEKIYQQLEETPREPKAAQQKTERNTALDKKDS